MSNHSQNTYTFTRTHTHTLSYYVGIVLSRWNSRDTEGVKTKAPKNVCTTGVAFSCHLKHVHALSALPAGRVARTQLVCGEPATRVTTQQGPT